MQINICENTKYELLSYCIYKAVLTFVVFSSLGKQTAMNVYKWPQQQQAKQKILLFKINIIEQQWTVNLYRVKVEFFLPLVSEMNIWKQKVKQLVSKKAAKVGLHDFCFKAQFCISFCFESTVKLFALSKKNLHFAVLRSRANKGQLRLQLFL